MSPHETDPREAFERRAMTLTDLLSAAVVLAMAAGAVAFNRLAPEGRYPTHMNLLGQVDHWADRPGFALMLWAMTGLTLVIALLMGWFTHDRRMAEQVAKAGPVFAVGRVIAVVSPALATGFMAAIGLGLIRPEQDQTLMVRAIMAFTALVILAVGEPMGKSKPNAIAGVRSYFTLTSRLAWDKSNRLVGRLFFWIGLAGVLAAPFAPQPTGVIVFSVALGVSVVWGLIEGWRVWKTDPERREAI